MYTIPEVIVTALRIPSVSRLSPSPASVIDSAALGRLTGTRLSDALTREGGFNVKDYGAPGALKTVSQRGLGAEHTLLLLNGRRISSVQNGLFDVGLLPLDDLERVEVLQGGQSASFGADAVAGLVNIVTPSPRDPAPIGVTLSAGSAGERRVILSGGIASPDGGLRASAGQAWGDGDYEYIFDGGEEPVRATRENADFRRRSASLEGALLTGNGTELSLEGRILDAERGVPGPVVSVTPQSAARQSDVIGEVVLGAEHRNAAGWSWTGSGQFLYSLQKYSDPLVVIGGVPLEDSYRNRDARAELGTTWRGEGPGTLSAGISGGASWADGSALAGPVRRLQGGAYMQGVLVAGDVREGPGELRFIPALRYDAVGDVAAVSPQAGLILTFAPAGAGEWGDLRCVVRASVGRNFRAPTFNELYYNGGGGAGNPELRPERSTGLEAGFTADFQAAGSHTLGAGVYRIDMEDRVVWVPAGSATVTPKNLRHVLSRGFDLSYRWSWSGVVLDVRYLNGLSTKLEGDYPGDPTAGAMLPYVPEETATAAVAWDGETGWGFPSALGATFGLQRIGFRYTTEGNTGFLPGVTVGNANVRALIPASPVVLRVKLEMENLFDTSYQLILGYPMPLRTVRFTLTAFL